MAGQDLQEANAAEGGRAFYVRTGGVGGMKEDGLKQIIEKMRGPRMHWKPKQGGTRMKKRVLAALDKKMVEIRKNCTPEQRWILRLLDSEEGK